MFCSNCGNTIGEDAVFCTYCGQKVGLAQSQSNQEVTPTVTATEPTATIPNFPNPKPNTSKNRTGIVVGVVVMLLAVVAIVSGQNSSRNTPDTIQTTTEAPTLEPTPVQWAPDGYQQVDEYIAYKFTTKKGKWPCQNCNFWKVTVIANSGCPGGVYGELNMLDKNGTVQEWSNDSIPALSAGETAVLKFTNYPYDSSLKTGELTTLTCHLY